MTENIIGKIVVECALHVHKKLGPGLLESVYEVTLAHELKKHGLSVDRQRPIPIQYDDLKFDVGRVTSRFKRSPRLASGVIAPSMDCFTRRRGGAK